MTILLRYSQAVRYITQHFTLLKILKIPIQKLLLMMSVGLCEIQYRKLNTTSGT